MIPVVSILHQMPTCRPDIRHQTIITGKYIAVEQCISRSAAQTGTFIVERDKVCQGTFPDLSAISAGGDRRALIDNFEQVPTR